MEVAVYQASGDRALPLGLLFHLEREKVIMTSNRHTKWQLTAVAMAVVLGIMVIASAAAPRQGDSYAVSVRLERERVGDATRFWLTGSVAPCPEGQAHPRVTLSIIGPAGQVVFDGDVAVDSNGSYRSEFHFQQEVSDGPFDLRAPPSGVGVYQVSVCYENARSEALIPILPPIGSAIIAAGYGDPQEAVNTAAEYAYRVLRRSLCLPRDRIYFLHPDLATDCDCDGQPDVDALPTVENLRYAIEDWASDKFCTDEQDAVWHTLLTLYIVSGSGGSDFFYLNEADPVWADDLACWLSTLKANICRRQMQAGVSACLFLPATVIVERRMSGSFLGSLANLHCSDAGDFTVCAEVCCATHTGTLRVLSRCVVGESVYLRAQVRRPHLAADCTVYVVGFPPAAVTESNIVLQLMYSPELGGHVAALPDGFTTPGVWQLLCVAVDPDGHLAVTSRELTTIAAEMITTAILSEVQGLPAPCNDDLSWLCQHADLLRALADPGAPGLIGGDCGDLGLPKPATCDADAWSSLVDDALQIPSIDVDQLCDDIQAGLGK